ncbi:unnamed protein product [Bursaphelenchus okinawaensis]|uniref:Uncharacterized protein n=1 Tax=Bursaphelenchus okinawaensis TaxID=465554 RepID=A0A811LT36_9BILA|nr:unnamed protein product [Bursaphelenchus okinawaensis]CAG9128062.1 unnamed protein product [Bursaphelenchus okinawaensis]
MRRCQRKSSSPSKTFHPVRTSYTLVFHPKKDIPLNISKLATDLKELDLSKVTWLRDEIHYTKGDQGILQCRYQSNHNPRVDSVSVQ